MRDVLVSWRELNSREREASLQAFREGDGALVCTDLAARGLDIPDVDHVVMFDFPRNPWTIYIARAGPRAPVSGKVTALVAKADRRPGERHRRRC